MDGLTFNQRPPRCSAWGAALYGCGSPLVEALSGQVGRVINFSCRPGWGPCAPRQGFGMQPLSPHPCLPPNLHPETGVFLSAWGCWWQGTSQGRHRANSGKHRIPEPACPPQSPFPSAPCKGSEHSQCQLAILGPTPTLSPSPSPKQSLSSASLGPLIWDVWVTGFAISPARLPLSPSPLSLSSSRPLGLLPSVPSSPYHPGKSPADISLSSPLRYPGTQAL